MPLPRRVMLNNKKQNIGIFAPVLSTAGYLSSEQVAPFLFLSCQQQRSVWEVGPCVYFIESLSCIDKCERSSPSAHY